MFVIGINICLEYADFILPNVNIGDNVIIGTGCVVIKDMPSGVLVAGNPCVVRRIINKEIYEKRENVESFTH